MPQSRLFWEQHEAGELWGILAPPFFLRGLGFNQEPLRTLHGQRLDMISTEDHIASVPREVVEREFCTLSATDEDVRRFRRIRAHQKRTQVDQWLDRGHGTRLRKNLVRINRALGDPGRIRRAVRAAVLGVSRSGSSVAARHQVGTATQFRQIFAEVMRSGVLFEEYYLYQLYLPQRWRSRARQFPKLSHSGPAQLSLLERTLSPDFQLLNQKHLFAAHCKEAGLPTVRLLAQFIEGQPDRKIEHLPLTDLFSKPAHQRRGIGAAAWRCDQDQGCFFNATTNEKFSSDALLHYFCKLSRSIVCSHANMSLQKPGFAFSL